MAFIAVFALSEQLSAQGRRPTRSAGGKTMARVLLDKVSKRYSNDAPLAVDNVSLDIDNKEFIVLVGPSGCGKSTTLKMVAGLESVTNGRIYIGEEMVNDLPPKDRNIAMVFQNYALYPNMNVFENIAFGLRLRKLPKYIIEEKVKNAAKILGIDSYLERLPGQLSGGQKQRVALGRAIVRNPSVFLMDEPLSNLDAKMRVNMRAEIIKLHRSLDTTTIYVTHDQTEAITMGDRIAVMDKGVVQQVGTPEEIYNEPANMFVAGFIGSPPMNFIKGRLIQSDGQLEFYTGRISLSLSEKKSFEFDRLGYVRRDVIMGVRPENLKVIGNDAKTNLGSSFRGIVQLTEFFGSDRYVYLDIDEEANIICRADTRVKYMEGTTLKIGVDMENVLFFDINTKKRIL